MFVTSHVHVVKVRMVSGTYVMNLDRLYYVKYAYFFVPSLTDFTL